MVAHGSHSPSPNHGFLVPLPDVGRTSSVSLDEERLLEESRGKSQLVERKSTKLAGLHAILSTVEYPSPKGTVVEETILAVRSGIVYTIGLRTNLKNNFTDKEEFFQIVNSFRLLKLPRGECSNF
jgi:hypothetical protein